MQSNDDWREDAKFEGIQKILVATDLTQHADRTVQYATALTLLFKARLLLLHAIDPTFFWTFGLEGMPDEPARIREELTTQLRTIAMSIQGKGVDCVPVVTEGTLRQEVIRTIENESVDLLVVGAHRPGSLRHLAFGSAFDGLIHEVACPVITIGPNVRPISDKKPYRVGRILLATDFSAASRLAASHAVSLTRLNGGSLHVAHVTRRSEQICSEKRLARSLRELVPELKEQPFKAVALTGDPARALITQSRLQRVDLILMGVKQASHLAVMFKDGTAHNVICRARCPVLTIAEQGSGHAMRPAFITEAVTGTLV